MSRVCLTLLRILLAGWVGAAVLFVVVGIREVTAAHIDSPTRDALVLLRFPAYYAYGTGSLIAAFLLGLAARTDDRSRRAMNFCLGIIALAGLSMLIDYVWIYRPLAAMLESSARPQDFASYHEASKWINALGVGLCLVGSVVACWHQPGVADPADVA